VSRRKAETSSDAFKINIDRLIFGGAGIGRRKGKVVFVPFSVPGDLLLVRPIEEKKQFTRAEIVRILKPGPGRSAPACTHFMKCGGCHWQQMEYSRQVEAKRQILEEIIHHRFPQTPGLPISMKASPQTFGYRSRARIQLRGPASRPSIGFFRCGSHAVEDIERCPLLRPALNEALSAVRQFKFKVDAGVGKQEMDIACSEEEDTWASALTGTSLNDGVSAFIGTGKREEVLLHRKIGEFGYFFTAPVFFQANDFMISELVSVVRKASQGAGCNSAIDLFAGVGLFTLPLALQYKNVLAIENSEAACRLCAKNITAAKLANARIVCSDVLQWMKETPSIAGLELLLLDPPRIGAGVEVMEQIQNWAPRTIIYVSCDPQTLCRDIAKISESYNIDSVEGLDMFPQTYHFETVVRLTRK
jgi:tRNA/tmRNA/rRNA uracil-C5-methylase (TrmA/RlmC/RlmD family)